MICNIPNEILDIIFNLVISPINCNSMKLRVSCKDFYYNDLIIKLQNIRNKCHYCIYIWRLWDNYPTISRNPLIYSDYIPDMTLCNTHTYKCNLCNRSGSYNEYNIVKNMCKECILNIDNI